MFKIKIGTCGYGYYQPEEELKELAEKFDYLPKKHDKIYCMFNNL